MQIIIAVLLFNIFIPLTAKAQTEHLSHQQMIDLYGQDYENALLSSAIEVNAKLAIIDSTNRNTLEIYINNSMNYIKNRINAYDRASQGNLFETTGNWFKEMALGVINIGSMAKSFIHNLFGENESEMPISNCSNPIQYQPTSTGFSITLNKECNLFVKDKTTGTVMDGRMNFYLYEITLVGAGTRNVGETLGTPVGTITYFKYLLDTYYSNYIIVYSKDGVVLENPQQNEEVKNELLQVLNNYDTSNKNLHIPQPQPYIQNDDGLSIVYPDGEGGFVDSQGQPIEVGNNPIVWKTPDVTYQDDELIVGGQTLLVDENVMPEVECDGVLCWVANIFKSIASIPIAIVSGLLDGLMKLLKTLFVPSADSFSNFINELNTTMNEKLNLTAYTNIFDEMQMTGARRNSNVFEGVTVSGLMGTGEVQIIDSSTINAMLPTIHSWVRGFFYVLLVFFNINHLYKMIRGTTIFESMRGKTD